jgi:hypothetical protein
VVQVPVPQQVLEQEPFSAVQQAEQPLVQQVQH